MKRKHKHMNNHIHAHISMLEEHHVDAILENMTTHALLTALLTGEQLQEHEMIDLMHDHIQEIMTA